MKYHPAQLRSSFLLCFPTVPMAQPLLFILNFWLVSQSSLWKLYPPPVPSVGLNQSSFWPLGIGLWVFAGELCGYGPALTPNPLPKWGWIGWWPKQRRNKMGVLVSNPSCASGCVFSAPPVSLEVCPHPRAPSDFPVVWGTRGDRQRRGSVWVCALIPE